MQPLIASNQGGERRADACSLSPPSASPKCSFIAGCEGGQACTSPWLGPASPRLQTAPSQPNPRCVQAPPVHLNHRLDGRPVHLPWLRWLAQRGADCHGLGLHGAPGGGRVHEGNGCGARGVCCGWQLQCAICLGKVRDGSVGLCSALAGGYTEGGRTGKASPRPAHCSLPTLRAHPAAWLPRVSFVLPPALAR